MTKVELVVTSSGNVDSLRLNQFVRELVVDLRSKAKVVVEAPKTEPRPGAKSGVGFEVGRIVLAGALSAATAQAVASVLKVWVRRRKDTIVRVRRGDAEVVIKGTSSDVDAALARLSYVLETTDPDS